MTIEDDRKVGVAIGSVETAEEIGMLRGDAARSLAMRDRTRAVNRGRTRKAAACHREEKSRLQERERDRGRRLRGASRREMLMVANRQKGRLRMREAIIRDPEAAAQLIEFSDITIRIGFA